MLYAVVFANFCGVSISIMANFNSQCDVTNSSEEIYRISSHGGMEGGGGGEKVQKEDFRRW